MKIYRAENIGSMLRPNYLLDARAKRDAGAIDPVSFKRIEDAAVDECIAIQEGCCVDVLCDGEMRRNVFSSQLAESAEGFESGIEGNSVSWFTLDGKKQESPVTVGVTDRIRMKRNLSAEEFTYLRAHTSRPIKMTIPSPTMYAYYWVPGDAGETTAVLLSVSFFLFNGGIQALGVAERCLNTELFPTHLRATYAGWLALATALAGIATHFALSGLTLLLSGLPAAVTLLAVVTVAPALAIFLATVPETRGLTLETASLEEV